jgi:hypothetical protein
VALVTDVLIQETRHPYFLPCDVHTAVLPGAQLPHPVRVLSKLLHYSDTYYSIVENISLEENKYIDLAAPGYAVNHY